MWLGTERPRGGRGLHGLRPSRRRSPATLAVPGPGPRRSPWRVLHSGAPLTQPLGKKGLFRPRMGKILMSLIKRGWGNFPKRPSQLQVGQFLPHQLPRGWLGPLCPLGGPLRAPAPALSDSPPRRKGLGVSSAPCSAPQVTPTPARPSRSPEGPARQRGARVEAEREPGRGRGRPAWEARRETAWRQGAIRRRLRGRRSPAPPGHENPTQTSGGGGARGWTGELGGGHGTPSPVSSCYDPAPPPGGWGGGQPYCAPLPSLASLLGAVGPGNWGGPSGWELGNETD